MKAPLEVLRSYPAHDGTVAGALASRTARGPERRFLAFGDREWTWGAFRDAVERTAAMLSGRGIGPGDRMAVMATNSDRYVLLFFALSRLRAILVPINPEFGPDEAGYVLEHAGVSAVACTGDTAATVLRAAAGRPGQAPWFVLLEGRWEDLPVLEDLSDAGPAGPLPERCSADDTCLIMYTSGTTGFPKGVMHSQHNFTLAGEGFLERMHLQPEDRLLCVLPLFHINALFYSLGGALAAGAMLVLARRFSASAFWPLVVSSGATEVNIIAAVGSILARRPRSEFVPGHRLRKVYGAPVTAEIATAFRRDFGVETVIEGYGMTEIPGACSVPFRGPYRPGSMGLAARHPDPAVRFAELRVVDEDGRDLPPGRTGELLVRTPIVMQGYYRDAELTRAAFRDGWFATGDLVRRDAEGFHFFVGRRKDIIRRRGENIAGAELDRVIGEHPAVMEAAAIAVPSELGEDEILVAVVRRGSAPVSADDIRRWCAGRLAPVKVPRYVAFVDALPHTPTHRVAKHRLDRDALMAQAADCGASAPGASRQSPPDTPSR